MEILNHVLSIEGKNFIGAGKIMYNLYSNEYNIPHLHFLVSKLENELYEAVNLEFSLFALGNSTETAIASLVELTIEHIDLVLEKGRGFEEVQEKATLHVMDDYWAKYRDIEFSAASKKQDIGHNMEQRFTNSIKNIITEKLQEELIRVVEEEVNGIIEEIKNSIKRINKCSFNILYQQTGQSNKVA